ncbi:MAG TPA: ATP-binding cassette domain-containing protein, partial [Anaerolineae bacterium]|nr:ATP-binding cassette domain-containing protein [Anaerolineae bacterium]
MDASPLSLIELRGITKRFPGVVANDHISLALRGGEIHTLLGENGAGKSTLLNILSGMLQPDEGQILIGGQPVRLTSPQVALAHGLGTVYQHFTLVSNLSVIENVMLGLKAGLILNPRQVEQRLQEMAGDFGLAVSPHTEVQYLSLGQQQRVEIIKVLLRGSRVLLLDEPTSVLTPLEVKELFEMLHRLQAKGVAIVFISHKLDEALSISDRITILRQGRWVGELGPAELTQQHKNMVTQRIVGMMFGESTPPTMGNAEARQATNMSRPISGQPICSLSGVSALSDRGTLAV